MLSYIDLWGEIHSLEEEAIKLLQHYEPEEGYWVAFSGGKDSIVILDLVRRSGVKHETHFSMTTVDPPEVYQFIKEYYPNVIWDRPKRSMFKLIEEKMMLPTRQIRFCCHYLKELGGSHRIIVVGVRAAESPKRAKEPLFGQSTRTKNKWFIRPILRWSDEDVWSYIRKYNLKYPSMYDEGYKRLGCIMCPLQTKSGRIRDKERYPKFYRAYIRAIKRMMVRREERGKGSHPWGDTPEEIIEKWING